VRESCGYAHSTVAKSSKKLPFGLSERVTWDMLLGIVFVFTSVLAFALALSGVFPNTFWVLCGIALLALLLSKQKLAIVGAAIAFVGVRLGFAAVATRRLDLLLGALAAGVAVCAVLWLGDRPERMQRAALVKGRFCSRRRR